MYISVGRRAVVSEQGCTSRKVFVVNSALSYNPAVVMAYLVRFLIGQYISDDDEGDIDLVYTSVDASL